MSWRAFEARWLVAAMMFSPAALLLAGMARYAGILLVALPFVAWPSFLIQSPYLPDDTRRYGAAKATAAHYTRDWPHSGRSGSPRTASGRDDAVFAALGAAAPYRKRSPGVSLAHLSV